MPPRTDPEELDTTRIGHQAALRGGRRANWLIPTGIVAAVAIAMLIATLQLDPVLPPIGIALIVVLYLVMVVCAVAIRAPAVRGLAFAWLTIGIAVVAVLALLLVLLRVAGG